MNHKPVPPALIIIDCQLAIDEFDDHPRSNPDAEKQIQALLGKWRQRGWPLVHVRHQSKFEDSPYHGDKASFAFKPEVAPMAGETIITKRENDAFVHTDLDALLQQWQVTQLVVCGVLTHHSVDATVRHGAALGYEIDLPEDCTASMSIVLADGTRVPAELVQQLFLANLSGEYCTLCQSTDL